MSASSDSINISLQVERSFVNEFDKALKQLQLDGQVPLNLSRSEAIRRAMMAAVEDPSVLTEVEVNEE